MNEPIIEHSGDFVFAKEQNVHNLIEPKDVRGVDELGNFTDLTKPTDKEIIVRFWARKQKKIALLTIVSAGVLVSILIQETNLFNLIFGNLFVFLWDLALILCDVIV